MKCQTWTFMSQQQIQRINSQNDKEEITTQTSNSQSHEHQVSSEQAHHIRQSGQPTKVNHQHDFITTQLD